MTGHSFFCEIRDLYKLVWALLDQKQHKEKEMSIYGREAFIIVRAGKCVP